RYIDGTFVITNTTLTLENPNLAGFIKDMWDLYKGYSQAELAAATHLPGTPWTMVRQGRAENDIRVEIPDELIYDYFHKKVIEINKEKAEKQKQDQQPNC
ncbi:MAG: hypothetical protein IAB19_01940, partial [Proteobacteria bacterium]|nr:hypothetical protein [Candidatus Avisuccinivibrio stercorigallinarum]